MKVRRIEYLKFETPNGEEDKSRWGYYYHYAGVWCGPHSHKSEAEIGLEIKREKAKGQDDN